MKFDINMSRWGVLQHDYVTKYIASLPEKDEVRVTHVLKLLKLFGPKLRMPHSKSVPEVKGLYELRKESEKKQYRLFYFRDGNKFVVVHVFRKQTQKTPKKEIAIAKRRMEDYLKRK